MKQIIIGLVGPIASGKGIIAAHLEKLGFTYQSLSDRVREEARSRQIKLTRENLQNIGDGLRGQFGNQVLAERTVQLLDGCTGHIVIDSIRNPGEIIYLQKTINATVVGIDAPVEARLRWYLERSHDRGEDGTTPEDFFRDNGRDLGLNEADSGQQVNKCLGMSAFIIQNIGSKQDLYDLANRFLLEEFSLSPEGTRRAQEKK
jgi:dephospho-CoA kinase